VPGRTGAGSAAQEVASTPAAHHSISGHHVGPPERAAGSVASHSPPSAAVCRWSDGRHPRRSRMVTTPGERQPSVLESELVSLPKSSREARRRRTGAVSEFGSGMGADSIGQVRSDAVSRSGQGSLTCADAPGQHSRKMGTWFGTKRPPVQIRPPRPEVPGRRPNRQVQRSCH